MPRVSAFYGIVIAIYFRDHAPPHFHAIYGEDEAAIRIDDGAVMRGGLPPRAARLVEEWRRARTAELRRAWRRAARGEAPGTIAPLP